MGLLDDIVIDGAVVLAILAAVTVLVVNIVGALEERGVRKDLERRRRIAESYRHRPPTVAMDSGRDGHRTLRRG